MTDLPPPVPMRLRTGSLGLHKTEISGLNPTPFYTPNPTSHGRPLKQSNPVVSKPIRAPGPHLMTQRLSPMTPPGYVND